MNEFEKKLFTDLKNGHSVDEILAQFNKHLDAAKAQVEAEKKIEEEKRAAELQKERNAKYITGLANRALNNEITSEDVAWLWARYAEQKWGKCPALTEAAFSAEDVDNMIDMSISMFSNLDNIITNLGTSWNEINKNINSIWYNKSKNKSDNNDDKVIKDFLNKIL